MLFPFLGAIPDGRGTSDRAPGDEMIDQVGRTAALSLSRNALATGHVRQPQFRTMSDPFNTWTVGCCYIDATSGPNPTFASLRFGHFCECWNQGPLANIFSSGVQDLTFAR